MCTNSYQVRNSGLCEGIVQGLQDSTVFYFQPNSNRKCEVCWISLSQSAQTAITNLDSISKNRDITLPTKFHLVKPMVFPVVMYGCENWAIKKSECRTDAFDLWHWRRLLRVPCTARRSTQSILKEISPEYSLGGLMLKHKLQYFGHQRWEELTHGKRPWCWESLTVLGGGNNKGWDGWMASPTW